MRFINCLTVVLFLTLLSGCFTYRPIELGDVGVGTQLRATLTPAETQRLRTVLATGDTLVVGTVTGVAGDQINVRVAGLNLPSRVSVEPLYQDLTVMKRDITLVEVRQLDRPRTTIAAIGGTAVAAIVVAALWDYTYNKDGEEPEGGPDEALIGLRFQIGLPRR